MPATKEEQLLKAQTISTSRVLSQEEFKVLQQRQAARKTEGMKSETKNKKKRKREEEENEERCAVIYIYINHFFQTILE